MSLIETIEKPARIGKVTLKGRENVVNLDTMTSLDFDPAQILASAAEHGLDGVIVIGYDADGAEYFTSSIADGGEALWLIERCKSALLSHG